MKSKIGTFLFGVIMLANQVVLAGEENEIVIKTSAQCGMCYDNIKKEFTFTKGVNSFQLNEENGEVTVKYNPSKTNPEKIRKAISKAGYDADDIPANPKAYEKLDACCKKGEHRKE